MNLDLMTWIVDGTGTVQPLAEAEFEVAVETPHTLWCPEAVPGNARFSFDCHLLTPNSAMLFIACARNWRGGGLFDKPRKGEYDEYRSGDLEMYTVGFNRTGNVSAEIQPNASSANIRRIGGPEHQAYTAEQTRLGTANPDMEAWADWNVVSLIGSAREFASGTAGYLHYDFVFAAPTLTMCLEGEELLTMVDHRANPLQGGYFAIRNMTPGGRYRIKNWAVSPLS